MALNPTLPASETAKGPGRLTLFFICLTVMAPMIGAYWIYESGRGIPQSTINKGQLIAPAVSIAGLTFFDQNHTALPWTDAHQWRMVTVSQGGCDKGCQDNLYVTHQVHVRLAKEAHRIQRLLLLVSNSPDFTQLPEAALVDSGLTVVSISPEAWAAANLQRSDNASDIVIVDQEGFAMMRYDSRHTGNDLLADLSRLLKYSYE
ncbi:hypothetical protein [Halioxenophilus sp. WMMB6]|uniref:hypothetical protein n=1 Tax=Halioxenophilus sp. WMMB6 TaxID=3073815 RepID=UPI00295ED09C|nr:hypothetical protein [Halioxenophilus sp. WMMB6]